MDAGYTTTPLENTVLIYGVGQMAGADAPLKAASYVC
jgi:hypothetical protein